MIEFYPMIDDKVQMMDAGMRLFESEKPYGIVLGGIKTEMAKYGKVSRTHMSPTGFKTDLPVERMKEIFLSVSQKD